MTYLEECMSLGKLLNEDNRRALFKFLLKSKNEIYNEQSRKLLKQKSLQTQIANGDILYKIDNNKVNYVVKKIGSNLYSPEIRELKLHKIKIVNVARMKKFMAQSEVEVIANYPLNEANSDSDAGFGMIRNPYYDLNYYSHGRGKIIGIIEKIKTDDAELLKKFAN